MAQENFQNLPKSAGQAPAQANAEQDERIAALKKEITIDTAPEIKREDIPRLKKSAIDERIEELKEIVKSQAQSRAMSGGGITRREILRIKESEESEEEKIEKLTARAREVISKEGQSTIGRNEILDIKKSVKDEKKKQEIV